MSMKKMIAGVLATGALMAAAAPAQAAITIVDTDLDVVNTTGTDVLFSLFYGEGDLENPFTAFLEFTNDLAGGYAVTLTTSTGTVDFTSAQLTGGTLGGPLSLVKTFDSGNNEQWGLDGFGLDAGTYILSLAGTNSAGSGGSLSGTIDFNAVPEPATWAMMLLGFAVVGGAMRSRQRQTRVRYTLA